MNLGPGAYAGHSHLDLGGCLHTLTPPSPLYATDGFDRRFEWFKHCTMKLSKTMKEIGIEPLWKGRARSNQRLEKQRLIYHALA